MVSDLIDLVRNKSTLLVLLLIGLLLSVYAGKLVYDRETDAIQLSFKRDFSDKVKALRRELFVVVEVIHGTKDLYDSSDNVTYDEFKTLVLSSLSRHSTIHGLSWVPKINKDDLDAHIAELQGMKDIEPQFAGFEISERNSDNLMVAVSRDREVYYPVTYIEPMVGNEKAIGYDIASSEDRRNTIDFAIQSGEVVATPTISLVQDRKGERGILILAPVYKGRPKTVQSREAQIKGLVSGVFKVGQLIDKAMDSTSVQNIKIEVFEGNLHMDKKESKIVTQQASFLPFSEKDFSKSFYNSHSEGLGSFPELTFFEEFERIQFANRVWGIKGAPFEDYVSQRRSYAPFLVVALGGMLSISIFGYLFRMLAVQQKLEQLSLLDSLTKVANKRGIIDYLNHEWERSIREKQSLSICMIDLDDFKKFNDTYGHVAGDRCLQEVAEALQTAASRSVDMVGRYGGEEFCLILPNTSEPESVAKDCLDKVADLHIPHKSSTAGDYVSISIGLATIVPQTGDSLTDLLKAADNALYEAKQAGRNQLKIAEAVEKTHVLLSDNFRPGYRKSTTRQPW
jgi:diguanylate cyclase (GGDEF)-like protein